MRVAMVVGLLMFNVIAGLYESGLALNASTDVGSDTGQVQACEDGFPPPPSWP